MNDGAFHVTGSSIPCQPDAEAPPLPYGTVARETQWELLKAMRLVGWLVGSVSSFIINASQSQCPFWWALKKHLEQHHSPDET